MVYLETETWLCFLAETKCVSLIWIQYIDKGWVVSSFHLTLVVEIEKKIICPESKQWSKPFVCLKWLTLLGGRIRTDDGASRRSYGILASVSTPVWAVPRLRSALIQKMCSPGVAGEVCSAQPGPHLLLLNCLWGVLIFSKGSRERHNEPKSVPPVMAQPQWEPPDGHPACGPELSCPTLFWWWTLHLLLWLVWESCEAVTQKSPSS